MTQKETSTMAGNPFPLDKAELLKAYRTMRTIREFEERLHVDFGRGDIPGFVHLYAGEEAAATGIMAHLGDGDRIASTHRGHGHCISKGVDVVAMMKEIYGKKGGACNGKGGSMHIADLSKGMMGANGILGAGAPLVCGAALAAKFRGKGEVAISFVGDGASNQGTFLESLNLAAVWNLPAIFVVENNGYAESTSRESIPMSTAPPASACRASRSTAPTSSPCTKSLARSSGVRAKVAARRCSNARWFASTAISRATRRPTAAGANSTTSAPTGTASRSSPLR
jgi:TPP-dependent pyruvate/acetoin dehydrogenase alpha subunit